MKASCLEFSIDVEDVVFVRTFNVLTSNLVLEARVIKLGTRGTTLSSTVELRAGKCFAIKSQGYWIVLEESFSWRHLRDWTHGISFFYVCFSGFLVTCVFTHHCPR